MIDYTKVKNETLEEGVTAQIHGVPLSIHLDRKGWFPIISCICVTEPCPCDKMDNTIIWLPAGSQGEKTGKQFEGVDVMAYSIKGNENLMVETNIPMTAAGFKKVQRRVAEDSCNPKSGLRTMAKGAPLPPGSGAGFFLSVAAAAGWGLGTLIDEESGASDKISDFLAENIPWPW